MNNMQETPRANRFAIGLFGKRNAGKSSLINAIAGQPIAVTSDVAGTTTDPVYKAMELLPIGPVVLMDTAGLDDTGTLGALRMEKTYEVLRKTNLALVVLKAGEPLAKWETELFGELSARGIPSICVLNQCDLHPISEAERVAFSAELSLPVVCVSATKHMGIDHLKEQMIKSAGEEAPDPDLLEGVLSPGQVAVLVTPIDTGAPKGRLILPQQQAVRAILEMGAIAVVTREWELSQTLAQLSNPPALVITDSQAFQKVSEDTPNTVPLTSFSMLFARQKGDLPAMLSGIAHIDLLQDGDRVLIVEGCTHHRQKDDIGAVKIPRWIREKTKKDIEFEWASGAYFPKDLKGYALIVHCGGCMLNRKEMLYRTQTAQKQGVPMTNYGVLIASVTGVLPRVTAPFLQQTGGETNV